MFHTGISWAASGLLKIAGIGIVHGSEDLGGGPRAVATALREMQGPSPESPEANEQRVGCMFLRYERLQETSPRLQQADTLEPAVLANTLWRTARQPVMVMP